jgi:MbtH protein
MPASDAVYKVVVNHEMEYSLWPAGRSNPLGWLDAGHQGSREQCLAHVRAVWTDMRPLSLRREMACMPLDHGSRAPERQVEHAC